MRSNSMPYFSICLRGGGQKHLMGHMQNGPNGRRAAGVPWGAGARSSAWVPLGMLAFPFPLLLHVKPKKGATP